MISEAFERVMSLFLSAIFGAIVVLQGLERPGCIASMVKQSLVFFVQKFMDLDLFFEFMCLLMWQMWQRFPPDSMQ